MPLGLKRTPFHQRTSALVRGNDWRRWSGHAVASAYELRHEREYAAVRSSAALFDVSPLFKYRIGGPDAERLLDRVVTRDVVRCAVGQVLYTPWCDGAGKTIDDGTVQRFAEDRFRLTSATPNLRWLHDNAVGLDVEVEDESDATAALALQGPASREILRGLVETELDDLGFFRVASTRLAGIPVEVSRTGYTGDLGYEIWVAAGRAVELWDILTEEGGPRGLQPAGIWALDLARIEAGLILIHVDYVSVRDALIEDQKSSPVELGLGWTVTPKKEGPFVGRDVLLGEKERGTPWLLRGIEVEWDDLERLHREAGLPPQLPSVAWRDSVPIYGRDRQVGYATSGCWSPLLKKYIAMAHLEASWAEPGTEVAMEIKVNHRRRRAGSRVVKLPFLDLPRKRA